MHVNVCKHCFKTFRSVTPKGFCPDCESLDVSEFERIEAYLKEYPNSNALQISESLGIDVFSVVSFLKEGRLVITRGKFSQLED